MGLMGLGGGCMICWGRGAILMVGYLCGGGEGEGDGGGRREVMDC